MCILRPTPPHPLSIQIRVIPSKLIFEILVNNEHPNFSVYFVLNVLSAKNITSCS